MVGPDEVDEELKSEVCWGVDTIFPSVSFASWSFWQVTEECGKYGAVEKVVIYQVLSHSLSL